MHPLLGMTLFWAITQPLRADLLVYEPFDYSPGGAIAGQNGGTGFGGNAWDVHAGLQPNQDTIAAGSLVNGAQVTQGNKLSLQTLEAGSTALRTFDTIEGVANTQTWASFLFSLNNPLPPTLSGNDLAVLSLNQSATRVVQVGVFTNPEGDLVFGIRTIYGASGGFTYSNVLFEAERTYSVVISIDWAAGSDLETVRLYLNPVSEPAESSAVASAQLQLSRPSGSNQELTSLEIAGSNPDWEWFFDEIRIGTHFADVIPEPSVSALLLLAAAGIGWRRSRQSR